MRQTIGLVFAAVLVTGCGGTSEATPESGTGQPSSGSRLSPSASTEGHRDEGAKAPTGRTLRRLQDAIADASLDLRARGVEVAALKVDQNEGVVVVVVSSDLAQAQRTIERRWPDEPLTFVRGSVGF